jgi:hypothetical protein
MLFGRLAVGQAMPMNPANSLPRSVKKGDEARALPVAIDGSTLAVLSDPDAARDAQASLGCAGVILGDVATQSPRFPLA